VNDNNNNNDDKAHCLSTYRWFAIFVLCSTFPYSIRGRHWKSSAFVHKSNQPYL